MAELDDEANEYGENEAEISGGEEENADTVDGAVENQQEKEYGDSDAGDEENDNAAGNASQEEATPVQKPIPLASFCEDDALKNDAFFIDSLATVLQTGATTSTSFRPHLYALKRKYLEARRSVKKRIESSKTSSEDIPAEEEMEEVDDGNMFANLFDA